jgi:hypothetical protein
MLQPSNRRIEFSFKFKKSNEKFYCLLPLCWIISYGQNIKEGVIQDISKAPLEMANVMAVNQHTKAMDAYAITDKGNIV